jgi:cellulose biosynthesis protein BcsQ
LFANTKIVSFISASGGVGKTKLSLLFSYYLKKQFRSKVLLIDLDPSAASSMYLLNDSELDECMEWKSLAGMMDQRKKHPVKYEDYKTHPMIYRERIDFLAPGATREVVDMVDDLWKSASAGALFLEAFEEIIPIGDYDFIIFDTIPFFDPRYTQLVLYPSDYIIIPLRPNLIDLKRTNRMIEELRVELRHKIRYSNIDISVGSFMKEKIFYGFNLVPNDRRVRETQFVRYYLGKIYEKNILDEIFSESGEKFEEKNFEQMSTDTKDRARALEHHAEKLTNEISLIPAYIQNYRYIDRFPSEDSTVNNKAISKAIPFLNGIYRSIS